MNLLQHTMTSSSTRHRGISRAVEEILRGDR